MKVINLSRQRGDTGQIRLKESTNQRRQLPPASSAVEPLLQCLTQQVTPALQLHSHWHIIDLSLCGTGILQVTALILLNPKCFSHRKEIVFFLSDFWIVTDKIAFLPISLHTFFADILKIKIQKLIFTKVFILWSGASWLLKFSSRCDWNVSQTELIRHSL